MDISEIRIRLLELASKRGEGDPRKVIDAARLYQAFAVEPDPRTQGKKGKTDKAIAPVDTGKDQTHAAV